MKVAAVECLVHIAELYYDMMEEYMKALCGVSWGRRMCYAVLLAALARNRTVCVVTFVSSVCFLSAFVSVSVCARVCPSLCSPLCSFFSVSPCLCPHISLRRLISFSVTFPLSLTRSPLLLFTTRLSPPPHPLSHVDYTERSQVGCRRPVQTGH